MIKKEKRGGKRKGAGRKSPFREATKGVKFMCPLSKVDELKGVVKRKFAVWEKECV